MTVPDLMEKIVYLPAGVAATAEIASILTGVFDVINMAVVVLLGVVAFFLKRLIERMESVFDKVTKIDERLLRLEVQHDIESQYKMVRRVPRDLTEEDFYNKERPNG